MPLTEHLRLYNLAFDLRSTLPPSTSTLDLRAHHDNRLDDRLEDFIYEFTARDPPAATKMKELPRFDNWGDMQLRTGASNLGASKKITERHDTLALVVNAHSKGMFIELDTLTSTFGLN